MKYKVGDKVRYDGGDWWFYGTVSAVFEHSISPCYRLSVERMEKKRCKFSITQFEFELEPYHEVVESGKDKRKWNDTEIELLKKYQDIFDDEDLSRLLKRSPQAIGEKRQLIKPEHEPETKLLTDISRNANIKLQIPPNAEESKPEPGKKQRRKRKQEPETETGKVEVSDDAQKSKISEAWNKNLELYQKGEKNGSIYNWVSINRKLYQSGELPEEKLEKLNEIAFPFVSDRKKTVKVEKTQKPKKERQKRKRGEAWDMNLEMYRNGEKSNTISSWMAQNRKEYKTGTLQERKLDKLMEINFPFETIPHKKNDNWHQRLEEWKKGERRSTLVQQWRQRSVKKYLEGKLEIDKVAKLKEVGILS